MMSVFFFFFLFTGVHLGCSLDLDPLQLSQARRLCWNQIRSSDERRLPPHAISIHLLRNFNFFCHIDSLHKSHCSQRSRAMEGSSGHNTVREEETRRIRNRVETVNLVNVPEFKKNLSEIIHKAGFFSFWDSTADIFGIHSIFT